MPEFFENVEEWKVIKDFPDYEVSDLGRVRSLRRTNRGPYTLKPSMDADGYLQAGMKRNGKVNTRKIHRLVLTAFVGDCPEGMECRHLDGNRRNARLSNLIWDTHANNCKDKNKHGTNVFGERNGRSKLRTEDIIEIRKRYDGGERIADIQRDFPQITPENCSHICNRKSWNHLREGERS